MTFSKNKNYVFMTMGKEIYVISNNTLYVTDGEILLSGIQYVDPSRPKVI